VDQRTRRRGPRALPVEDFLDGWFAPEAQTVLHALVARLKSKA